jgi:hypothetical protein
MPERQSLEKHNAELSGFPDRRSFVIGQQRGWCRAVRNACLSP